MDKIKYEKLKQKVYEKLSLKNMTADEQPNDDYIDLKNAICYGITDFEEFENEYNKIELEMNDYIFSNDLDDIFDEVKIKKEFKDYENFMCHNQATLISLEEFIFERILEDYNG